MAEALKYSPNATRLRADGENHGENYVWLSGALLAKRKQVPCNRSQIQIDLRARSVDSRQCGQTAMYNSKGMVELARFVWYFRAAEDHLSLHVCHADGAEGPDGDLHTQRERPSAGA